MKLTVLALGTRMPAWVEAGVEEYRKRLPPELKLDFRELPLANRNNTSTEKVIASETGAIRKALPGRDKMIVLAVTGRSLSTEQLAQRSSDWQMSGDNFSMVIGGPDGVESSLLQEADLC